MEEKQKGADMEVGKKLKDLRLGRNMTQKALAEALGTPLQYISQLECGDRQPGRDILARYCEYFQVSPAQLGIGDDKRTSPAISALLEIVKDWSEADIFRLAADATELDLDREEVTRGKKS